MVRQGSDLGMFDAFVGRDRDERARVLRDDDSTIEAGFALAVAPREEAVEDLLDFIEPARSRRAEGRTRGEPLRRRWSRRGGSTLGALDRECRPLRAPARRRRFGKASRPPAVGEAAARWLSGVGECC